jgi:hypothetical protein
VGRSVNAEKNEKKIRNISVSPMNSPKKVSKKLSSPPKISSQLS